MYAIVLLPDIKKVQSNHWLICSESDVLSQSYVIDLVMHNFEARFWKVDLCEWICVSLSPEVVRICTPLIIGFVSCVMFVYIPDFTMNTAVKGNAHPLSTLVSFNFVRCWSFVDVQFICTNSSSICMTLLKSAIQLYCLLCAHYKCLYHYNYYSNN